MKKQIELEYKMMVSKRQFTSIKNKYPFGYPFKQINYYYDTKNLDLGAKRYALRIREVDNQFILTLKTPQTKGVMEFEQAMTSHLMNPQELNDTILDQLHFINPADLVMFGSLTTYRSELQLDHATICLDENFYHNVHDYEIEYEVKKEHDSYPAFLAFLADCGIKYHKPAMGKARRVKKAVKLL